MRPCAGYPLNFYIIYESTACIPAAFRTVTNTAASCRIYNNFLQDGPVYGPQLVHLMHDINALCKSVRVILLSTSLVVVVVFVVVVLYVAGGGVFSSLRAIRATRRYY